MPYLRLSGQAWEDYVPADVTETGITVNLVRIAWAAAAFMARLDL